MTHRFAPAYPVASDTLPTTLMTHPRDGSSRNCLAMAIAEARREEDIVVFVSGPSHAVEVGHVVLEDRVSGQVWEAGRERETDLGATLAAYLDASGRRLLAKILPAALREILDAEPHRRGLLLGSLGAPVANIGNLRFGGDWMPGGGQKTETPSVGLSVKNEAVHAWLDALGNSISDADKDKLAQTGDDASTLLDWFNDHKRGDSKLNDMPQNVLDARKRLSSNDAIRQRITVTQDGGGTLVTRDALGDFVKSIDSAALSAKDSWSSFAHKNADTDSIARLEAVNASILQANMPILDKAGDPSEKADKAFSFGDLEAVASGDGNQSLTDPLKNAAKLYANAGELRALDSAGLSPAEPNKGMVNDKSFKNFLNGKKGENEDVLMSSLQSNAVQQIVAENHGDASKVGKDYFDNGKSDATGADKAAAIVQLGQTIGKLHQGQDAYTKGGPDVLNNADEYHEFHHGAASPGEETSDFVKQVQSRIDKLSADPDVQKFMMEKLPGAMKNLVASDPAIMTEMKSRADSSSQSQALVDAFNLKDDKGKQLGATDALATFVSKPTFYSTALGAGKPDLSKALSSAPKDIQDKIKQTYDDITSGKAIADLIKSGLKPEEALTRVAVDKTVYDSVLDKTSVQAGTDKMCETVAKLGRAQLTDGKSADDMVKGLGVSGTDDPKLKKFIDDNINSLAAPSTDQQVLRSAADDVSSLQHARESAQHGNEGTDLKKVVQEVGRGIDGIGKPGLTKVPVPDSSTTSGQVKSADIIKYMRTANDLMRSGLKFDDSMSKLNKDWKGPSGSAGAAYKAGVLHGVSALFLAGAMGASFADGKANSKQTAQQSLQVADLLAEGGAKYYATTLDSLKKAVSGGASDLKELGDLKKSGGHLTSEQEARYESLNNQKNSYDKFVNIGKDVENTGKAVGGIAGNALGFITGAIGAADAAKKGDVGGAAAQGVFAGLNGISMVASAGEVATYLVPRLTGLTGKSVIPGIGRAFGGLTFDAVGAGAGVLSGVAGIAGAVSSVGTILYAIITGISDDIKMEKDLSKWYDQVKDGFAPSGISVPDKDTLLSPPNGRVPQDDNLPNAPY